MVLRNVFRITCSGRTSGRARGGALLATLAAVTFGSGSAAAQVNSFPRPSYFRETFGKSPARVELAPPVRLQDFVVEDSKKAKILRLSLRDYLSLVMANNTDIAIQRLTVSTAENAVLRS